MTWVYLGIAIIFEVLATLSLRKLADGARTWVVPVIAGYVIAFTMLSLTLGTGMPLGVAYGIWAAAGVALIAIAGRIIFKEPISRVMALGLLCIAGGVLLVQLGQ